MTASTGGEWSNPDRVTGVVNHNIISGNQQRRRQQRGILSLYSFFIARGKMSSPHDSEEEDTSQSDEALEEVNSHIKEAFEILKRETKKVRMEREALDEAAKKLEHVHFSTMVKLNVGGHLFSTSLSTLNKDPGIF